MLQQQVQRKQKSFALQRGLYVLRYESAADPAVPPVVTVTCEQGRNETILHPEQQRATMSAPGQALVIRALDNGTVQVEISSTGPAHSLDATLKFEPLRRDSGATGNLVQSAPAGLPLASQTSVLSTASDTLRGIQVLGHVARLGDVAAGLDQWLGGPSAPSRIEGFSVRWPGKPADVSFRYAATVGGQRPGEARLVEAGDFTGTRGRARPLLGFMMELSGPGARNYQLTVESLFLGSPPRRASGQTVTASGPTGREPLVGLRIGIVAQPGASLANTPAIYQQAPVQMPMRPVHPAYQATVAPPQTSAAYQSPAGASQNEPQRVRVFRG